MEFIIRRMFQENDLLMLHSESDEEAKILMRWGEMKPRIVARTPVSEKPNSSISQGGVLLKAYYKGQLQILFGPSGIDPDFLKRLEEGIPRWREAFSELESKLDTVSVSGDLIPVKETIVTSFRAARDIIDIAEKLAKAVKNT